MRRIIVESPFKSASIKCESGATYAIDEATNILYARACCLWATEQGYSPYASHLFFTQFLDDAVPEQRQKGIEAGLVWGKAADERFFFVDRGFTEGMVYGFKAAEKLDQPCRLVKLGGDWELPWMSGVPTWDRVLNLLRIGI